MQYKLWETICSTLSFTFVFYIVGGGGGGGGRGRNNFTKKRNFHSAGFIHSTTALGCHVLSSALVKLHFFLTS